uniref:Ig-like domain-containing protein n=1 Tax=Cacopsylla melanoneura TaxID=428564 RepID=A0A8D8WTI8_9HEMI
MKVQSQKWFTRKIMPILYIWMMTTVIEIQCLHISGVKAPLAVLVGDNVTLRCSYDLEGEPLYMIKWYKGGLEFYRYVLKELPHQRIFPTTGINVDVNQTDDHQVTLLSVEKTTRGRYRVEVSTDAPDFYTAIESVHVDVVEPPTGDVNLQVEETHYAPGEILRAICHSPVSNPPMNITWSIQGRQINHNHVAVDITQRLLEVSPYRQFRTESTLTFPVNRFYRGRFTLGCEASLYNLIRREASYEIFEKKPRVAQVILNETEYGGCASVRGEGFTVQSLVMAVLLTLSKLLLT